MSTPRKPQTGTYPGGLQILETDESPVTTSGSGMTLRKRSAPLGSTTPAVEALVAPAEAWALDVLKRAGIAPDGKVKGRADTQENYAQRFVRFIRSIREKVTCGDAAGAAADAIVLGGFIRESQLKFKWESHVDGYEGIRELAAEKGSKGGRAKGRIEIDDGDTNLTAIIAGLPSTFALDQLGEFTKSVEVWPELFAELDRLGLHPREAGRTITYAGRVIERETFNTMLSQARKAER